MMHVIPRSSLLVASILLGSAGLAFSGLAFAQAYPNKPLRMIVPFPPGGAADVIGRTLAQKLGEPLGQHVIVDNRAGASGNIGAEMVARAPADGYTLLLGALTSHSINYTLERETLRYNLEKDLSPISIVGTAPYVLVVHPSVPARSLKEFVVFGKANPGALTYASSGAGAPQRLAAEILKVRTGIDMLHVPFKGSGPAIVGLLGGQVHAAFESVPATLVHVNAGKLRALIVTTDQRVPMLPDVPTAAEAGLPDFQVNSTFGLLAPAGTPRTIIDRLNDELTRIVLLPDVKEKLLQQGAFVTHTTPEEAAQRIRSEVTMWAKAIREGNIKTE